MEAARRSYTNEARLNRFETFNSEFERQLSQHNSYRSAFEATRETVGNQYSSFESFKSVRSQKKKRKK